MIAVQFSHVDKFYGNYQALKSLSLEIHRGEVVALLGPNGAGKSTTLDILLGLKKVSAGRVEVLGSQPNSAKIKSRVTCIPQELSFPPFWKVQEVFQFAEKTYSKKISYELSQQLNLENLAPKLCAGLSGGEKRRLALALAFLPDPEVVVLDEPTTGLDVDGKFLLWSHLREFKNKGGTLIITSHDLYEVTQLASHVVMIDQGRSIYQGLMAEVLKRCQLQRVTFECVQRKELDGLKSYNWTFSGEKLVHTITAHSDSLVKELIQNSISFCNLRIEPSSLIEIFEVLKGEKK